MEAKDPASGASYYYNESTGKSQWERPVETSSRAHTPSHLSLMEDWIEAVDETSGMPDMQHISIIHFSSLILHNYNYEFFFFWEANAMVKLPENV